MTSVSPSHKFPSLPNVHDHRHPANNPKISIALVAEIGLSHLALNAHFAFVIQAPLPNIT